MNVAGNSGLRAVSGIRSLVVLLIDLITASTRARFRRRQSPAPSPDVTRRRARRCGLDAELSDA